ncbi:MAG: hypothetical protein H7A41_08080 [Chlamydiales bacterium]|nr:hypothetical protein [Chlamydiales bacterium]
MATATQAEGMSHSALCDELRVFLESDENPEHAQIHEIIQKVEEIKARILGMANGGVIGPQGSFPLDKIQEVQQCVIELQQELQKVYVIHTSVAQRWAALKMDQKIPEETITDVTTTVLSEYQNRGSNIQ